MPPNDPRAQLRILVDRMRRARNATTKTYMPTALLAVCDLAEKGMVHEGVVRVADYRQAFKRLMLEVWPEREDIWFRPMLHVKEHGMWQPLLRGIEVPYEKNRVSRLNEARAEATADAFRLDPVLRVGLSDPQLRQDLRRMVYEVLEGDGEQRSTTLARVHEHLDPAQADSDLLQQLLEYEHRRETRDAYEDLRRRRWARQVDRQGQTQFRAALLDAYRRRCCMSGADAPRALEAAHIHPFMGSHSNDVTNGLLLRGDLHTLFDDGLITVASTLTLELHQELLGTAYTELGGKQLQVPQEPSLQPNSDALAWHRRKNLGEADPA